jgi:hypothetical protein
VMESEVAGGRHCARPPRLSGRVYHRPAPCPPRYAMEDGEIRDVVRDALIAEPALSPCRVGEWLEGRPAAGSRSSRCNWNTRYSRGGSLPSDGRGAREQDGGSSGRPRGWCSGRYQLVRPTSSPRYPISPAIKLLSTGW